MRLRTLILFLVLSFTNYSYSQNNWQLGLHIMPAYIQESQQISPVTNYVFEKLEPQFAMAFGLRANYPIGKNFDLHPGLYYHRQKLQDECYWRSVDNGGFESILEYDCQFAYSEKQEYGEAQLAMSFQWPGEGKIKPYALAGASVLLLIGRENAIQNKTSGEISTKAFFNDPQVWLVPQFSVGIRQDITAHWAWYVEPTYRFYLGSRNNSTWGLGLGVNYSIP